MKKLLRTEHSIIWISALLILLTGILVSIAVILPLYYSIRTQIAEASAANARAKQANIETLLESYHALAEQISSRSEIRNNLEAWLNHDIGLEQLQAYTRPRLEESTRHLDQLAALFRLSNGQVIAALGDYATLLPPSALQPVDTMFAFYTTRQATERTLIKTSAPIHDGNGAVIGYDILFFYTDALLEPLQDFNSYAKQADLFLYQPRPQLIFGLQPGTHNPYKAELRHNALRSYLEQPQLQQAGVHTLGNGQNLVVIVQPFAHNPVSLIITLPKSIFYKMAYRSLLWVYVLLFSLLMLAIMASRLAIKPLLAILTLQNKQLAASQAELQLTASVFENTREAIAITDTTLRIVRANPAMQTLCGPEAPEGKPLSQYLSIPNQANMPLFLLQQLSEQGRWQGEVTHTSHGVERTGLLNVSTIHNVTGQPIYHIHIISDITARIAVEQKNRHLAAHDPLTGLLNRSSIMAQIRDSISQQIAFSILFIDLDKFKPVNDQYGHQAGDETLRLVASRLLSTVRSQDYVARFGGDEFLIMLETPASLDVLIRVTENILHQLIQPFDIGTTLVEIGASVGIAHHPQHGNTADTLIHAANLAMYCAKRKGGNRYFIADGNNDS